MEELIQEESIEEQHKALRTRKVPQTPPLRGSRGTRIEESLEKQLEN